MKNPFSCHLSVFWHVGLAHAKHIITTELHLQPKSCLLMHSLWSWLLKILEFMCHHMKDTKEEHFSPSENWDGGKECSIIIWGRACCGWRNQISSWLSTSVKLLPRTKQKLEKVTLAFFTPSPIRNVLHGYMTGYILYRRDPAAHCCTCQHKIHSKFQQKLWERVFK